MKKSDPMVTPWQMNEQDFPRDGNSAEKLQFLLRYAILAPSSHNTLSGWDMLNRRRSKLRGDH